MINSFFVMVSLISFYLKIIVLIEIVFENDFGKKLQDEGYGHYPVCVAKTQYSFSTDPQLIGRPKNFDVPLRDVTVSAGRPSSGGAWMHASLHPAPSGLAVIGLDLA